MIQFWRRHDAFPAGEPWVWVCIEGDLSILVGGAFAHLVKRRRE
jgi:hypothetical protein